MPFDEKTMKLSREIVAKARADAARDSESREEKLAASIAATETTSAAFACGVANGRHGGERGEITICQKFPADLAAGVALQGVAALVGSGSNPEPHAAALATGALAACAYRYGERLSRSMRESRRGATATSAFPRARASEPSAARRDVHRHRASPTRSTMTR